jgi:hypothetical protein
VAQFQSSGFVSLPMLSTLWAPEMRAFRRDPRFARFANGLKLTEYWRRYGPPDECVLAAEKLTCS